MTRCLRVESAEYLFAQRRLLRYVVVLRVWSRTTLAQAAEVNLLFFIIIFLE